MFIGGEKQMDFSIRKSSLIVGVLFILAAVSSVIGGLILYKPILNDPDYLVQGSAHANQVILGAVMELILVVSAVGTATTMFPILRKYNETIALWHLCFRFLEAVIITIGIISVLSIDLKSGIRSRRKPGYRLISNFRYIIKGCTRLDLCSWARFHAWHQHDDVQLHIL